MTAGEPVAKRPAGAIEALLGAIGLAGFALALTLFVAKRDLTLAELDVAITLNKDLAGAVLRFVGIIAAGFFAAYLWLRVWGRAEGATWKTACAIFLPLGLTWLALFVPRGSGRDGLIAGLLAWCAWRALAGARLEIPSRWAEWTSCGAALLFAGTFGTLNALRIARFDLSYDLAFFSDVAAQTIDGNALTSSFVGRNLLSHHFMPIVYPISLLFAVLPSPYLFAVLQALAVALAAVVLFRWTARVLDDKSTAFFVVLAYLANTRLWMATSFLFHPEAFQPLFFFSALLFIDSKAPIRAGVMLLLLLSCKEDSALLGLVVAAYAWVRATERWMGMTFAIISLGVAILFFAFVRPALSDGAAGYDFVHRYEKWGASPGEVVRTLVTSPLDVFQHIVTGPSLASLSTLLFPLLLVPLRAGLLGAALLVTGIHLVSSYDVQQRFALQYYFPVVCVVGLTLVVGLARRAEAVGLRALALACAIGVAAWNVLEPWTVYLPRSVPGHVEEIEKLLAGIPDGAKVSADFRFIPYLVPRARAVPRWMTNPKGFEYVALDLADAETDEARQKLIAELRGDPAFVRLVEGPRTVLFARLPTRAQ